MEKKKPYSPPKIFQVELNQEQAVLAACTVKTASLRVNSPNRQCKPGASACRKEVSGGDSKPGTS
jgi:hypothetical protein